MTNPTLREFLGTIYGYESVDRVHVAVVPPGDNRSRWAGFQLGNRTEKDLEDEASQYFCIALMQGQKRLSTEVLSDHLIIADDIGTKVGPDKEAELLRIFGAPTFQIETSPGNQTWGWKLAAPVLRGDPNNEDRVKWLFAIREHMKREGLTDAATTDSIRYTRLPFGVNTKEKYKDSHGSYPSVQLVHWNPNAKITIAASCENIWGRGWIAHLEANPDLGGQGLADETADKGVYSATMDMPIIKLAELLGMDPRPGGPGKVDALCPFEDEHTGGVGGFAFLGLTRGDECECHHGHCKGRDTADFKAKMYEQYAERSKKPWGPLDGYNTTAQGFLMNEQLRQLGAAEGVEDRSEMLEVADDMKLRWEEWELKRDQAKTDDDAKFAALCKRFVYVAAQDSFYDFETGRIMSLIQVDHDEKVLEIAPAGGRAANKGSSRLLNAGKELERVQNVVRLPGSPRGFVELRNEEGVVERLLNVYVPSPVVRQAGIPTAFFELAAFLVPDVAEREFLMDVMAFTVQKGNERTPLFMILGGGQGIGKDVFFDMFWRVLGHHNCASVSADVFASPYNDWIVKRAIYLPEFSVHRDKKAQALLKRYTSAGDLWEAVNAKYGRRTVQRVCPTFWATTNDPEALGLEPDDRRVWLYMSEAVPVNGEKDPRRLDPAVPGSEAWFSRIVGEGKRQDGYLMDFLMNRDLRAFNPSAKPTGLVVSAKADMAYAAASAAEQYVSDLFYEGGLLEHRTMVTFSEVEALANSADLRVVRNTLNVGAVSRGLALAGWVAQGRKRFGRKGQMSIWTRPDFPANPNMNWRQAYETEKAAFDLERANAVLGVGDAAAQVAPAKAEGTTKH